MQYISGVSFFRLYLKSFKPLYAPKEILILEEISRSKSLNLTKLLCCYFKRMLNNLKAWKHFILLWRKTRPEKEWSIFLKANEILAKQWCSEHARNVLTTDEISSFVIYYSNKALSNQRPFHKSVENPRDQNKESSSNSQTFSRALRRE
jgi:hypothetical protein